MISERQIPYQSSSVGFREVRPRTSVIAFLLGTGIIAASIYFGHSFTFSIPFLPFSFVMTLLWKKAPRPWTYLVSISAAVPTALFRYQFACNVVFASWFALFNTRYLFRLPKWIYVPTTLAVLGILTSSINWMSEDVERSIMRQVTLGFNFILGPFLFLPAVYLRMRESRDHVLNLKGLLFCLIVPSTLILISAKFFGTVANAWEASLHAGDSPEGFLLYRLGRVIVNFSRTEVGFILAALICASTAIAISRVKALYRWLAGACLLSNTFLLLATASFGSGLACLCGLVAIFYTQSRTVKITKLLISMTAIACMLLLTYSLSPPNVKKYLAKRYEHRITNANQDRLGLWLRALEYSLEHPEGIGFTLVTGSREKIATHNDYLAYIVSYGFLGGMAYTALVIGLLVYFLRRRRSADHSAVAIHLAGLGVIVALAVNSMTDHLMGNRWYFNLIWSVVWYSYFCSRAAQKETILEGIPNGTGVSGRTASHEKSVTGTKY